MSKKKLPDISKLIQDVGKKEVPIPPTIEEVAKKKNTGPDPAFNEPTKKILVKLPIALIDRLKRAAHASKLGDSPLTMSQIIAAGLQEVLPNIEPGE